MTVDKFYRIRERLHDRPAGAHLPVLIAVGILYTLIIYPNLLATRFHYSLGDVAEKDIKASRDFLLEDQTATEIKRQQAVQEVLTVFDIDTELAGRLARTVDEAFTDMRALRASALDSRAPWPPTARCSCCPGTTDPPGDSTNGCRRRRCPRLHPERTRSRRSTGG